MRSDPRRRNVGVRGDGSPRSCSVLLDTRLGRKLNKRWLRVDWISRSGSKLGRRGRKPGDGGEESGRKG